MTANLNAEDVKDKLFHTLKTRGVLDSLKSQLRKQLIRELQDTTGLPVLHSEVARTEEESEGIPLFQRAANSIVAEYLKRCHFEYTLSTFLPESGTSLDKMFSSKDILHLLNIDPESNLYINLERSLSSTTDSKGFLWNFLNELGALQSKVTCDINIQTDDTLCTQISSSLEEKLSSVEKKYSEKQKLFQLDKNQGLEEKLIAMQKKYELQKENELEEEIKKFKASELSRLRMEERQKYDAKIKTIRQEYDEEFNIKNQALRTLEKEMLDRVKRLKEVHHSEAYAERQKFLEEMRSFKERETELKNKAVMQERSLKVEEERLMNEVEKLKAREDALKEKEKLQSQRFNTEVKNFKSDYERQYSARNEELLRRESRLEAERQKLDRERDEHKKCQGELAAFREKCFQLQSSVEAFKLLLEDTKTQKHALKQKLAEMEDYHALKEKEIILLKDIEHLTQCLTKANLHYKEQEKKHQELIKDLTLKSGKPSKEVVILRQALKDSKEKYEEKEQSLHEAQRTLEIQLEAQIERANHFQKICEEQLNSQRFLETEIENLKMMQEQTERLLGMELRHQNANNSNMLSGTRRKHTAPKTPVRRKIEQGASMTRHEISSRISSGRLDDEEISTMDESSLASIIEDRKSFEKFEREAAALDASYRDFQSRMIIPSKNSIASIPSSMTFRRLASYHSLQSPPPSGMNVGSGGFTLPAQDSKEEFRPLKQVYDETDHDEQSTTAKNITSRKSMAKSPEMSLQNEYPDEVNDVPYEDSACQSDSEVESGRLIDDESVALSTKDLNSADFQSGTINITGKTIKVVKNGSATFLNLLYDSQGSSDKQSKPPVAKNTELYSYSSNRSEKTSGKKKFPGQNSSAGSGDETFEDQVPSQAFSSVETAFDQTENRIAERDVNSHNANKSQALSGPTTPSSMPREPLKIRSESNVSHTYQYPEEHKIDSIDDVKKESKDTNYDEEILPRRSSTSCEKSSSRASVHDNRHAHSQYDNSKNTKETNDIGIPNVNKRRRSPELDMEELEERRRRDTEHLQRELENCGKKDTSSKNSSFDARSESTQDISGRSSLRHSHVAATVEQVDDEKNDNDPPIDPVMLKYMEMIKQRRENEVKKSDEKSISITRTDSNDASDHDSRVSIGKDEDISMGKMSDDDFNWD